MSVADVYGCKPLEYKHARKPLPPQTDFKQFFAVEIVLDDPEITFVLEPWFAALIGWMDVMKVYIEHLGCYVDMKNSIGQTPLLCACEHSQVSW